MDGSRLNQTYGLPALHLVRALTPRQVQFLGLLAAGIDKSAIAHYMRVNPKTVYKTFDDAARLLQEASRREGIPCPDVITTPMWVRWGVLLGVDREIVRRPIMPSAPARV